MRSRGKDFEQVAKKHLLTQGLRPICDNFHCRFGEIDLIMADNDALVFVEVKYRAGTGYGGAVASVSPAKRRRIINSARCYLHQRQLNAHHQHCRFDVVAISGPVGSPRIEWLKNAFILES